MADTTSLEPNRFFLKPEAVVGCFEAIGERVPQTELYASLQGIEGSLPPALLNPQSGLLPEIREIFRILSNPDQSIAVDSYRASSSEALEARLLGRSDGHTYVMVAVDEDSWDLAVLTSAEQVLAVLEDMSGLGTFPSIDSSFSAEFTFPSLLVLAAFGDLLRERALRDQVERVQSAADLTTEPIAIEDIRRMLKLGVDTLDPAWCVTRIFLMSGAVPMELSDIIIGAGVSHLVSLGLIDNSGSITSEGLGVTMALCGCLSSNAVSISSRKDDEIMLERLLITRSAEGLMLGVWDGLPNMDQILKLREVSAGTVVQTLDFIINGNEAKQFAAGADRPSTVVPQKSLKSKSDDAAYSTTPNSIPADSKVRESLAQAPAAMAAPFSRLSLLLPVLWIFFVVPVFLLSTNGIPYLLAYPLTAIVVGLSVGAYLRFRKIRFVGNKISGFVIFLFASFLAAFGYDAMFLFAYGIEDMSELLYYYILPDTLLAVTVSGLAMAMATIGLSAPKANE